MVQEWKVLSKPSFSDHSYISFQVTFSSKSKNIIFRNPRNANWDLYKEILSKKPIRPRKYKSCIELEKEVRLLATTLVKAYKKSCPPTRTKRRVKPPWWNKELGALRRRVHEFFKLAKIAENEFCWNEYRDLLKIYKKEIRKAKRESWKDFCSSIEDTNEVARIRKLQSKNPTMPRTIRKINGEWTDSCEDSLEDLVSTHFPGCTDTIDLELRRDIVYDIPENLFTTNKIEWAIQSFDPFKSPGLDGIFPAMLQKVSHLAVPWLRAIFMGCLEFNYVPVSWREARVVFIPKAGKSNPLYSKEYRPISLTSFLLKTLEKILDAYIRDTIGPGKLSKAQHAYTKGRSVETALHSLVLNIEKALDYKDYALGVFLDISGAFNNVTKDAILNSMKSLNVQPAVYLWIKQLLACRMIRAEWNDTSVTKHARRGTPQGGVLSPLLWLLVVNELLKKLDGGAPKLVAYADDIAIVVTGKYLDTISNVMNNTLKTVHQWASRVGLGINAEKTDMVLFTRKYKVPAWNFPRLGSNELDLKDHTKYLGVILDSKLLWKHNVEERVKKASNALYACKRMLGVTWGLSPSLMHWCYTAIVRPVLLYGALVWWSATRKSTYLKPLERIQRLAALCITGALKTTPTAALEMILSLPPIDLMAENLAAKSAGRLRAAGVFTYRTFGHSSIGKRGTGCTDYMTPRFNWERRFHTTIEEDGWHKGMKPGRKTFHIYTDGSKTMNGVGAGIYCSKLGIRQAIKLPDQSSIFQAEVFAVGKAAELAYAKTQNNSTINIYVDSQAAIKAISSYYIKSKNVLRSREAIERLAANRRLHIYWVPGHKGIVGNEIVDAIAKSAVNLPFDQENDIQKPLNIIHNEMDDYMKRQVKARWTNLTTCKTAKVMCGTNDKKLTQFALTLSRKDCRTIIGMLTGHNLLAAHAYKIGIASDAKCRKCRDDSEETLEHLLCLCPALSKTRLNYLGAPQFEGLKDISKMDLPALLRFAKSVDILRDVYFKSP